MPGRNDGGRQRSRSGRRGEVQLSAEDRRLWREVNRETAPLKGRRAEEQPIDAEPAPPKPAVAKAPPLTPPTTVPMRQPAARLGPGLGLDRLSARRLRQGRLPISATLDLHGHARIEALDRLEGFLRRAIENDWRCVRVITGHGIGREGSGVLRRSLPEWLRDPAIAPMVVEFTPARPEHGGQGAYYIYLRRRARSGQG